jgi:hypothetical protein
MEYLHKKAVDVLTTHHWDYGLDRCHCGWLPLGTFSPQWQHPQHQVEMLIATNVLDEPEPD